MVGTVGPCATGGMSTAPATTAATTTAIALHCGDCAGSAALPESPDSPTLVRAVRDFLTAHDGCAQPVTMDLPRQRSPEQVPGSS